MYLVIILFLISYIIQLFLYITKLWRYRRFGGLLSGSLVILADILLAISYFNHLWFLTIEVISVYELFSIYRSVFSKLQTDHLQRSSLFTTLRLLILALILFAIEVVFNNSAYLTHHGWGIFAIGQLIVAIVLLKSTIRHNLITKKIKLTTELVGSKVPTLTVAIPARNETESLNECLTSLIETNYPKLEILVLDDQSNVRRTPEIIRSFAHNGVIFVAGSEPPRGWLAKNWGYQRLLEAANGEMILFCGADCRFDIDSLRYLVSLMVNRDKTMVSIVPLNVMQAKMSQRLFQPLRYAWEICLPRRMVSRPPVLSTCWIINKKSLNHLGGFKSIKNRMSPESYFASKVIKYDGYSFMRYDGVVSDKTNKDQLETAIRVRYPQLRRQPEFVALVTLTELTIIFGLLGLFVFGLENTNWLIFAISLISIFLYGVVFMMIGKITYRKRSVLSFISWPVEIFLDIWLVNLSMWKYEFGSVYWKGRSITTQVMSKN